MFTRVPNKRLPIIAGLATVPLACGLFLSGVTAAQAGDATSSTDFYNSYTIENLTDKPLILDSQTQYPEKNFCSTPKGAIVPTCFSYSEGFGKALPDTIPSLASKTFSVPVYVFRGSTIDLTDVVYRTPDGEKVSFTANQVYNWDYGKSSFYADNSECSSETAAIQCAIRKSSGSASHYSSVFTLTRPWVIP